MSEDKLALLLEHMIGRIVVDAFIEDDAFVIHFDDDSLVELYSSDGDLDLYFEIGQEPQALH